MLILAPPFARGYLDAFTLSAPEVPPWTALLERGASPAQRAEWEPLINAYRNPAQLTATLPPLSTAVFRAITAGLIEQEVARITTMVGTRWWWGASVLDSLPNYGLQRITASVLVQQMHANEVPPPRNTLLRKKYDVAIQTLLQFVRTVIQVPIQSLHTTISEWEWLIDIVVERCPFCTLPQGCGVWYGLWSGVADWLAHRPHPKLGSEDAIIVSRPTNDWHHVRITLY